MIVVYLTEILNAVRLPRRLSWFVIAGFNAAGIAFAIVAFEGRGTAVGKKYRENLALGADKPTESEVLADH